MCIQSQISNHEAICPYISVQCIYCLKLIKRCNVIKHEQETCTGAHNCLKCGMTIQKNETIKMSHNCFTSLAGYLTNMLDSKDYVIKMF